MYRKILVILLVLAILPNIVIAQAQETTITNPEMVKSMKAKITQTGGVDITGSISDLTLNVSIPIEDQFQTIESITVNHDYELITDEFGNRYIEMYWAEATEDIEYTVEIVVSTQRRLGGSPRTDSKFLQPTDHVESESQEIIDFASQFEGDDFTKIATVTEWIHENIYYDRQFYDVDDTALQTLRAKRGVCDEITNLLLASSRSLGYHSAAVMGWVVGEKITEPHSWAEIYVGNELIHNDPTWAEVGFLDAAHIKYATLSDTVFRMVGVKGRVGSGDDLQLIQTTTKIELIGVVQEPLTQTTSVLENPTVWEDEIAVIKTDINYNGCLLTKFRAQSCEFEGKEFLEALEPEQIIYFCDQTTITSSFKVPTGLDPGASYTCPLTVYSYVTGREDIDVNISSMAQTGSIIDAILNFFRSLFGG